VQQSLKQDVSVSQAGFYGTHTLQKVFFTSGPVSVEKKSQLQVPDTTSSAGQIGATTFATVNCW
jgi:hypothetical protein